MMTRSSTVELSDNSRFWRQYPQSVSQWASLAIEVSLLLLFIIQPVRRWNQSLGEFLDTTLAPWMDGMGFRESINVAVGVGLGIGLCVAVFVRCFKASSTGIYTYCRLAFDFLQCGVRITLCITWASFANAMEVNVYGLPKEPHTLYNGRRCRLPLTDMKMIADRNVEFTGLPYAEAMGFAEEAYPPCKDLPGGDKEVFHFTAYGIHFPDDPYSQEMKRALALDFFCGAIVFCNILVRVVEAGGNPRVMRIYDTPSVVNGGEADRLRTARRASRSLFKLALFHPLWLDVASAAAILYAPPVMILQRTFHN